MNILKLEQSTRCYINKVKSIPKQNYNKITFKAK